MEANISTKLRYGISHPLFDKGMFDQFSSAFDGYKGTATNLCDLQSPLAYQTMSFSFSKA